MREIHEVSVVQTRIMELFKGTKLSSKRDGFQKVHQEHETNQEFIKILNDCSREKACQDVK